MYLDCHVYNNDFRNLKYLHEVGSHEKLVEWVQLLLCDFFYDGRRQSKLKTVSEDSFW